MNAPFPRGQSYKDYGTGKHLKKGKIGYEVGELISRKSLDDTGKQVYGIIVDIFETPENIPAESLGWGNASTDELGDILIIYWYGENEQRFGAYYENNSRLERCPK